MTRHQAVFFRRLIYVYDLLINTLAFFASLWIRQTLAMLQLEGSLPGPLARLDLGPITIPDYYPLLWGLWPVWFIALYFGDSSDFRLPYPRAAARYLKVVGLNAVVGAAALMGIYILLRRLPRWGWVVGGLGAGLVGVVIAFLMPVVVNPWFNTFEPLDNPGLSSRIRELAAKAGIPVREVLVMDASRQGNHSNAYFTGIGKSKRIVLFDTLVEQMSIEQGLAVLAHEMGHYKMRHIPRMLIVQMVFSLTGLYVVSLLLDYRPLYAAFSLAPSHHAALVLFSILAGPVTFVLGPMLNVLSRKHEYEADCFAAATLRNSRPMEEALITLTLKNAANLTPHPWYSAYHYSHPSPVERIEALRQCPV